MSSATEQLTKVEDQILDTLSTLQKPVLDAVKTIAEKVEGYVPEVPGSDNLSDIDALVLSQFTFIEKLVANQKDFALSVIDTIKEATAKAPAPKAKPKTTKSATVA